MPGDRSGCADGVATTILGLHNGPRAVHTCALPGEGWERGASTNTAALVVASTVAGGQRHGHAVSGTHAARGMADMRREGGCGCYPLTT